jgi:hypothetical protein
MVVLLSVPNWQLHGVVAAVVAEVQRRLGRTKRAGCFQEALYLASMDPLAARRGSMVRNAESTG